MSYVRDLENLNKNFSFSRLLQKFPVFIKD